jgi:pimeloyl-ACP methyl ester carboxylesterase
MPQFLTSADGLSIAYNKLSGDQPTVMFLPGFFSHMQGTKATWLEKRCRERGQAYIRFDYRGHGESDGKFEDGTITDWLNDTLLVLDEIADKPVILVGSSMGGWIALLAALERPESIAGLVGIASSPDFTRSIWEDRMNDDQKRKMIEQGYILQPSEYQDDPVIIKHSLIKDGKNHLLLNKKSLDFNFPVCLIHGKQDTDVSWKKSLALQTLIGEGRCELIIVPDGEHRLSRQKDLELIDRCVQNVALCRSISRSRSSFSFFERPTL